MNSKFILTILVLMLVGCKDDSLALPDRPIINFEVTNIKNDKFIRPYLPALRFSGDGRIGISTKKVNNKFNIFLITPERLESDFNIDKLSNDRITSSDSPSSITLNTIGNIKNFWHSTICDPSEFSNRVKRNPYVCGSHRDKDCYDLKVISVGEIIEKEKYQLISTPITIRVSNPKTAKAKLEKVTTFKSKTEVGKPFNVSNIFEPMIVGDGRLLVSRVTVTDLNWIGNNGEQRTTSNTNLVYSVYDENSSPCDIKKWTSLYPISHAPYDIKNKVPSRYDFAHFPFRDHVGNIIPDGKEIGGSYHWIDRKAKNIFLTTMYSNRKLFYFRDKKLQSRYKVKCLDPKNCLKATSNKSLNQIENGPHGYSMFGLWTSGKMILLDGQINHSDYALRSSKDHQKLVKLYSGEDGWVRVGAIRDNRVRANSNKTRVFNTTFVDSLEERLNYSSKLKPKTPRDIVWKVSSGVATDEIIFDDYLNNNMIIFAEMTGAMKYKLKGKNSKWTSFDYLHGDLDKSGEIKQAAYLQNSSTIRHKWLTPNYGVLKGKARIEPVALGGIKGKGLWLSKRSTLNFSMKKQEKVPRATYFSLFIDIHQRALKETLVRFPNGESLTLVNDNMLELNLEKERVSFKLPRKIKLKSWYHIGIQFLFNKVELHINGMLVSEKKVLSPISYEQGDLVIGGSNSLSAWIDEVKLIFDQQGVELACNHARGTIIKVLKNEKWQAVAKSYSQSKVRKELQVNSDDLYACFKDYSKMDTGILSSIPQGTVSIRDALTFPEGPIVFNKPRPDSSKNKFCISCHDRIDAGDSLGMKALVGRNTLSENDRRQPMQAPRKISGVIPKNLFGKESNVKIRTPKEGVYIDQFLHGGHH